MSKICVPDEFAHCSIPLEALRVFLKKWLKILRKREPFDFIVYWPITFRYRHAVELVNTEQWILLFSLRNDWFLVSVNEIVDSFGILHIFDDDVACLRNWKAHQNKDQIKAYLWCFFNEIIILPPLSTNLQRGVTASKFQQLEILDFFINIEVSCSHHFLCKHVLIFTDERFLRTI